MKTKTEYPNSLKTILNANDKYFLEKHNNKLPNISEGN